MSQLYFLKNENEKREFLEKMKSNGFSQLENAGNELQIGKTLWFIDDLIKPNILISIKINVVLDSINWRRGFLLQNFKNENLEDLKSILSFRKKYNAIQNNLNEKIENIYFGDIKDNKLIELLQNSLKIRGFKTNSGEKMSEYIIKLENIDEKISELEKIIDKNVVLLTLNDIDFVNKYKNYKSEFTYDELKCSIESGFSYGYRIKKLDDCCENVLASWGVIWSDGQIGNFHTQDRFSGTGYGNQVKAKLIICLLKNNITPISHVYDNNNSRILKNLKLGYSKTIGVRFIDAIYNQID
ncbi:hypothetical protein DDB_G0280781 [Dictyostelium discoideum AX4]|uniref:N-acetyltransferase domain-containing protein n=1 Tax=Dictyostelium discoideum TaxID=44689 RepID=Q54UW2_DICDI|nr:hypothetical protein DDB_G0280781 [Dictyostelium discoideum AX4]EAL67048.1 hypothetical protein DDB_G0280781 [Dictyostelium discoideum AX4]|eukprot:XP_641025.1 hypothetical protein DDB_G0280781 [Dictyostelium discoideum AX4]